jgi:hypothetical protein
MEKQIHVKPAMYALFYEHLKIIASEYGYNLVLHGSMNRDLDLIAIPWIDNPKDEFEMIQVFDKYLRGTCDESKEHYMFSVLPGKRNSYVINLNRGDKRGEWNDYDAQYYIDISITQIL